MKNKKLLFVLFAMLIMLGLAGCGKELPKPFDYDENEIVISTMNYFMEYANVSDDIAPYYITDGTEFEQSAIKGITQARETDKVGAFEDFSKYNDMIMLNQFSPDVVDADVSNSEDSVMVKVINHAQDRDVEISIRYVENPDYYLEMDKALKYYVNYYGNMGYTPEAILAETGAPNLEVAFGIEETLNSNGIYPFVPEEMVVVAVYTKGELLKSAGLNTLLGMGTVFVVLIFISFIISLFKYLPALFAKKTKLPEAKPVAASGVQPEKNENLMKDAELVAIITAAIYTAEAHSVTGAVSKDKLIVRSIRRAR